MESGKYRKICLYLVLLLSCCLPFTPALKGQLTIPEIEYSRKLSTAYKAIWLQYRLLCAAMKKHGISAKLGLPEKPADKLTLHGMRGWRLQDREKAVEGLAQKPSIGSKMRHKLGHGGDVGQVAASLAGDT